MYFDVNVLDADRQRITNKLLRNGYYKFNKDYIGYTADTVRNTYNVDLTQHLQMYKAHANDSARAHRQYWINKINFITDYDVLQSSAMSSVDINDSVHYKGYPIYYKDKLYLRPKVLTDNLRFASGDLYNERDVQQTYSSFGRLSALKYTNIRFIETQIGDSTMLDCYVMLTKSKHKSIAFEVEGTNSAGDLGAAASVSFQNRNLFRGSETFMIKFRGAYEVISGLQAGYSNNNYTEYGVETSINFPNFLFPFISSDFKRKIRATTEFGLQYNYQLRPEFLRTMASANWSYKWTQRQKIQHRIDLINIAFLYLPRISDRFKEDYINKGQNHIFQYNYQNRLIVNMGYSYNYNSVGGSIINNTIASNSYSIRFNFESAGNIMYVLSKATNIRKNSNGEYAILGGKYYFMWSEGGWGGPDYSVAYAIADSPFGPFERVGKILQQDTNIATGAGHHSVVKGPGSDEWYIIYHRRPLGETAANSRATCIDRMYFNKDGKIEPVRMTFEGVGASPLATPVRAKTYANPVINFSLPDPTIIKGDDEYYYLYATESIKNVPIHRSRDLVNWYYVGTAFTDATRPNFEPKGRIWAPDINKIGDKYVMYYSMSTWGGEWTCGIGIATADKPEGPFTDLGKLFRSNEINIQNCIDPFYIEDNGKKYLFWGSFHGIYGTELTDDGLSLKKGAPIEQIAGTAYEGTYIHKRDGYYYLFASIGRCCEGLKSTYTTVVGRSKNLFGPYVDKKGRSMSDNHHEILIQKNKAFVGPGHNSELVTDKKGNDWMFYHAVSVANPEGRVLMMDRVQWKGGWPFVKGAVPSLETAAPDFR